MFDKMIRHIVQTGKAHRWLKPFALLALFLLFGGAALVEWTVKQSARAWQAVRKFKAAFSQRLTVCRERMAKSQGPSKGKAFKTSHRPVSRLAAAALSVCMVFTLMPQTAFAAEVPDTQCGHHPVHTAECGYQQAVEGQPCGHTHTADCYAEQDSVSDNTASPSDAEESEPTECTHVCSEETDCITEVLDCPHKHDDTCGYVEAIEGADCTHTCELCNPPKQEEIITDSCVCDTLCTEGVINPACPVCSAKNADLTLCEGIEQEKQEECTCETKCTLADEENAVEESIDPDCPVCGAENADLSLCKGVEQQKQECTCQTKCTLADEENAVEESIDPDCPVCSAENADLSLCKGAPAMLMAPRATPTPTVSGSNIYANGAALILAEGSSDNTKTVIYIDSDGDGQIDSGELIFNPNIGSTTDGTTVGNKLSGWSIYGGGTSALTGNTQITMLGGQVDKIYGGGNGARVSGGTEITITGGKAYYLYGGGNGDGATVSSTSVTVSGGEVSLLYGGSGKGAAVTGSKTVTVGGGAKIGSGTSGGIAINGGSRTIGVASFVIGDDLSGDADSVCVNLPEGYTSGTIATDAERTDLAKIKLVGTGAKGNEAYFYSVDNTIRVREKPTPEVNTNGEKIYANGAEIIIVAGTTADYTNILYDKDGNGTIGNEEYLQIGDTAPTAVGYDLSGYDIFGGGTSALNGDTKITMTGGTVDDIHGGGYGAKAGNTSVTVSGGTVRCVYGGGYVYDNQEGTGDATVNSTTVTISGSAEVTTSVYGGGFTSSVIAGVTGKATVSINGGTVQNVYGGSYAGTGTATVDSTDVTVSGGTVTTLYGGGYSANVTNSATVSVSGGTVTNLYGGGRLNTNESSDDVTVGSGSSVTVGGNATIGSGTGGIIINGGTTAVSNGVDKFVIGDDLSGADGSVCVNLPAGYDVTNSPTIATEAVQGDLAKIKLVGTGAEGNEAYFENNEIKVKKKTTPETTPTATFTATGHDSGTLSGLTAGESYKYSTDGGSAWTDFTGATATIASGVTTTNGIQVVKKGNGTTTTDSAAQTITVTQAATPSGIGKTDETAALNDGKITGVKTTMEYKLSTATDWTAITGTTVTGLADGTYHVRVKASGAVLASANAEVVIAGFIKTTPTVSDLSYSLTPVDYNGSQQPVTVTAKDNKNLGDITVKYGGSTTAPTNAGTYAVTVDIAGNAVYNSVTDLSLGDYTINKAENVISHLTLAGWTYGGAANAPTATATYGTPTYTYSDSENGTYNAAVPTQAGTYWVKAEIAESENYKSATAKTSFAITKADTDPNNGVMVTNSSLAYGEALTVTYTPAPQVTTFTLAPKTARLYYGTKPLGAAVNVSGNGAYTMSYNTNGKDISIGGVASGENGLHIKFGGDDNLNAQIIPVTGVTLAAKTLTAKVSAGVSKDYDQDNSFANVVLTLTGIENGDTVSATADGTSADTNAGTHDFTAMTVALDGEHKGWYSLAASGVSGNITINKIAYTGTTAVSTSVYTTGETGATVSLPVLPDGASYGTPSADGTVTMTDMSIAGTTLTYTAPVSTAGQTGTISVPVTEATNYNDYNVVVTVTYTAKTPQDISYANANVIKTYGDSKFINALTQTTVNGAISYASSDTGVATVNVTTGEITIVGQGSTTITATAAETADYAEATASYTVTVAKKSLELKADDKSMTKGSSLPTFTYQAIGLVNGDTVTGEPTIGTTTDGKTTGKFDITISGGTVANSGSYTITYTKGTLTVSASSTGGSSSSGGNPTVTPPTIVPPSESKPNAPTTAETEIKANSDGKGGAEVTVSKSAAESAIEKAQEEAKRNNTQANGIAVQINVAANSQSVNSLTVNLPKVTQKQIIDNKVQTFSLALERPDITLSLSLAAVQEINRQANADVQLTATRLTDTSKLSGEAKAVVGARPLFRLTATYKGGAKTITDFGSGSVTVEIPYQLQPGESAGGLYLVYIDGQGKPQFLMSSSYDPKAEVLRGSTTHFSLYAVGYKAPTVFSDIQDHWAKEDIEFVVARGILAGTGNGCFSPDGAMTRGMFVTALGRLASVDPANYKSGTFTDVKATAYYAPYVEWAEKNGVVKGIGGGLFAPDQSITREQMAVIMANYAKVIGFPLPKVHAENTFADNAKIGAWAKDAVKKVQMAGVISGKNNNSFDPKGAATRAEVSAVLKRFVELVISIDTAEGWTMNDSGSRMYYQNGKAVTGTKNIDGTTHTFDRYGVIADVPKNRKYGAYIVQKGDSFWLIAYKHGCTMKELEVLNDKSRFSLIHPGDVLKVPEK
ncbi:S-layer homology domain-containing protein [Anaerotruncus rubiinfantis]|uniref:S-layer homology domain-containing protein n=1 Tax=Anaerotruncus rubiinfantis TaxID=1720200 RepID=UPI00083546AE|nr:S-layer homology domain-containing protein [Anaerotruncus rubiinfantis]